MRKQLTIKVPLRLTECYKFAECTKDFKEWRENTKTKIKNSTLFNSVSINKNLGVEIIFNDNEREAKDLLLRIKQILDVLEYSQIINNDKQVKHLLVKRIETKQKRNTCRFYLNKNLKRINITFSHGAIDINSYTLRADTIKYDIKPNLTNNNVLKDRSLLKSVENEKINTPKNSKLIIGLNLTGLYKATDNSLYYSFNGVDIDSFMLQISNRLQKPNNINEIEAFFFNNKDYSFFAVEPIE